MTHSVLQHLMLPDPDLPHDLGVFVRLSGGGGVVNGAITLPAAGATVQGDTYANLFNLGTWTAHGMLRDLALRLVGTGQINVYVWQVTPTGNQTLIETDVALTPAGVSLPLRPSQHDGLLMWSLTTRKAAQVYDVCFTVLSEAPPIALAIVITTFQREDAVQKTASRIAAFLGRGALPAAHLFVIDNGQTVTLPPDDNVSLIPNRNLGGAGGFARGLAAARATGDFTHVLFMDDDAAFQMENLVRTAAFLRHAAAPKTALAGAMVNAARPWELWENGAIFDQTCHPQYPQADLRDLTTVTAMELEAPTPKPTGFYGGWWYFAFPLTGLAHDPFPFFVRGDDVSFSISNHFHIATLNGVMSLQDAFPAKASPQTAYLDARYHLHVHIVQEGLRLGRFGTIRVAMRLFLHSLMRMHYDTAAAQLLAWEDMLQGPSLFTDNITMTNKRAQISALTLTERWGAMPASLPPTRRATRQPAWHAVLMRVTLNGHLLPGFASWGRAVTLPIADRGRIWSISGAARAVTLDGNGGAYTVTHSKVQFLRLMAQAMRIALRWGIAFPRLARAHRAAWPRMTTPAFWATQFTPFPPPPVNAYYKDRSCKTVPDMLRTSSALPDPALLNAPLTALMATTGTGRLTDPLPVAGLRLMADPAAQMNVTWSSPRDRLIEIASTVAIPGQWFALRLTLDLPNLTGLAGIGIWLRSAAAPALTSQVCLRSGVSDSHIDCYFERHVLSHAAQSDHHALMLCDRTPDLPRNADWRELLLFLPPARPIALVLQNLRIFTVPA